jgi:hypothetical protein
MDDDPVLRSLGEDLARDDPRLAALLGDPVPGHRRWRGRVLLVLLVVTPILGAAALLVPPTVAVGVATMLLVLASPLAVCWLCATDDRPTPGVR